MGKLIFVLLLFSQSVCAAQAPFSDFFPDQQTVFTHHSQVEDFRLALSKPKKINNRWVLDREQLVSGELYRRTIELDSDYYLDEVIELAQNYFAKRQAQELFLCNGLDCGSSNAWANNYFELKRLYGMDSSQACRVWRLKQGGGEIYVSNYIVQRGNKRIYVHLDVLTAAEPQQVDAMAPDPKSISVALNKLKYYRVPQLDGDSFATTNSLLQPLAEALRVNAVKKIVVVGHDYTGATPEQRKINSANYADQVAQGLRELGIKERRLSTQGLGSLVPQLNIATSAVFLVFD